ncbi:hypothetical protein OTU49_005465, partial [Cherax quadricarinatus]
MTSYNPQNRLTIGLIIREVEKIIEDLRPDKISIIPYSLYLSLVYLTGREDNTATSSVDEHGDNATTPSVDDHGDSSIIPSVDDHGDSATTPSVDDHGDSATTPSVDEHGDSVTISNE